MPGAAGSSLGQAVVTQQAIQAALTDAGLNKRIVNTRNLSGGCIHTVLELTFDDNSHCVAKISPASKAGLFLEESAGLRALAQTQTLITPTVVGSGVYHDTAVLLMTRLVPSHADDRTWNRFGEQLAALHLVPMGHRYGFEVDNHLGTTPQPNRYCDDWVEFNAVNRLGHQLRLLDGVLERPEQQQMQQVIGHLDRFIPRSPKPSLLHGDLWSGNALATIDNDGQPCVGVIDPACSIGDGWADIAMMQLFGGFPTCCFDAYRAAIGSHDDMRDRIAVYQLYHVLNHITIFGRGYVSQAMALAKSLAV